MYLRLTTEIGLGLKEAMLMEIAAVYKLYDLRFKQQGR